MKVTLRALVQKTALVSTAFILAVSSLTATGPFVLSQVASAATGVVNIYSLSDLNTAIENQADGQVWNIYTNPTGYGLTPFDSITAGGQAGWYFPITVSNLTINGVGNPIIWGDGFSANGNWSKQNFVSIFGDNVTIKNLTLMSKVQPNKTVEVIGNNSTIENVSIKLNTKVDPSVYDNEMLNMTSAVAKQWAGSIYYNDENTYAPGVQTNHTLKNLTLENSGVSVRTTPAATVNVDNVHFTYRSNVNWINEYRFYSPNGATINGSPKYTYQVSHGLNNLDSALANIAEPYSVQGEETLQLISDLFVNKQINVKPNLTITGAKVAGGSYTVYGNFAKTDNSNNAILGLVGSSNVTINSLIVDGAGGTNLHGINVYESTGVNLNDVTLKNNPNAGMVVGRSSDVTVNNIATSSNGWYGINVDRKDSLFARLTVNGVSTHDEGSKPHIYSDDRAKVADGSVRVNDPNLQYVRYWLGAGHSWVLDLSNPTAEVTVGGVNPTDFAVKATDDQGLATIQYSLKKDGVVIGDWSEAVTSADRTVFEANKTTYKSNNTGTHLPILGLDDGAYTIDITATDARGKVGYAQGSFTVDHIAPTVPTYIFTALPSNVVVDNNKYTAQEDFKFDLTSSTDVVNYKLKYRNDIEGAAVRAWNPTSLAGYQAGMGVNVYKDRFSQGEGKHYFSFSACDAVGNCSAFSPEFAVIYDNTAPDAPIILSADANGASGTAEPGSSVVVRVGAVGLPAVTADSDGNWSVPFTPALATGSHTVTAVSTDAAGNTSDEASFEVVVPAAIPQGGREPAVALSAVAPAAIAAFTPPAAISPTEILGDSDQNTEADADVEGSATENILAQAVDSDANNGKLWGLDWYWWLLILAGIATIIWWAVAAVRRGKDDQ